MPPAVGGLESACRSAPRDPTACEGGNVPALKDVTQRLAVEQFRDRVRDAAVAVRSRGWRGCWDATRAATARASRSNLREAIGLGGDVVREHFDGHVATAASHRARDRPRPCRRSRAARGSRRCRVACRGGAPCRRGLWHAAHGLNFLDRAGSTGSSGARTCRTQNLRTQNPQNLSNLSHLPNLLITSRSTS